MLVSATLASWFLCIFVIGFLFFIVPIMVFIIRLTFFLVICCLYGFGLDLFFIDTTCVGITSSTAAAGQSVR